MHCLHELYLIRHIPCREGDGADGMPAKKLKSDVSVSDMLPPKGLYKHHGRCIFNHVHQLQRESNEHAYCKVCCFSLMHTYV